MNMYHEPGLLTQLTVMDETYVGTNVDNGATFAFHGINVEQAGREPNASSREVNLARTADLAIALEGGNDIDLPDTILQGMASYLRERPATSRPINCLAFVQYINGLQTRYDWGGEPKFERRQWDVELLHDEMQLSPGESVAISESRRPGRTRKMTHFALCLSGGMYLSKFGFNGNLIAATLPEMQKGFGGDHAFKMTPRKSTNRL